MSKHPIDLELSIDDQMSPVLLSAVMSLYSSEDRKQRLKTARLTNLQGALATMRAEHATLHGRVAQLRARKRIGGLSGVDEATLETLAIREENDAAAIAEVQAEINYRLDHGEIDAKDDPNA